MINNETTSNIKLTDEHTKEIEQYQVKLSNLLSEIVNATKILKGTTLESNRAVKERAYQEELLNTLTPQVETKIKELADLKAYITERTALLNELLSQFKEHTDLMAKGKADHDDRETNVKNLESSVAQKQGEINNRENRLLKEQADFNAKVAKLKEVISTF